ncbi:unnamed protein product [Rotaria magnacalcarata]|uniref:Uncharacterized protein n=1 Tax=Rotaria magnacalcarata TaxID=392030 RepID=A0A819B0E4_9BILA|nr:unnamed protein product [Rotaria magnacalcarata]
MRPKAQSRTINEPSSASKHTAYKSNKLGHFLLFWFQMSLRIILPKACQQFLNHIDTYFLIDETSSSCSELTIRALSIENQFSEYIQTINQEITEVSELQIFIHQSSTDVTFYENLLDAKLQDLDNNEYINYHNTLLLMLFDRWQRSRQMSDTARNLFNLSSLTDINNDTFINEIYTLISNTAYHASIIKKKQKIKTTKIKIIKK